VTVAVRVVPARDSLMVVDPTVEPAVTRKAAVVFPPGTVTVAGTVAMFVLPLDKATATPAWGAGPLNVTVPVAEPPTKMIEGIITNPPVNTAGATVKVAAFVTSPAAAVIVAWPARLAAAWIVKVPEEFPAEIVMLVWLGGTVVTSPAGVLVIVIATGTPAAGALSVRLIVTVAAVPVFS